jgi:hypothetical protein
MDVEYYILKFYGTISHLIFKNNIIYREINDGGPNFTDKLLDINMNKYRKSLVNLKFPYFENNAVFNCNIKLESGSRQYQSRF